MSSNNNPSTINIAGINLLRHQWMEAEQAANQARNNYIGNLEHALQVSLDDGQQKVQQLASKDQQLASKDQQIQSLQSALQQKDQAIRDLEQKLNAAKNQPHHSPSPIGVVSVASSVDDEDKCTTPATKATVVKAVTAEPEPKQTEEPKQTVEEPKQTVEPCTNTSTSTITTSSSTSSEPEELYKRKYAGGFQAAMERAKELDKRRRMAAGK